MNSYTNLRSLYAKFTMNNDSANLTDGDLYINDSIRKIMSMRDWWWLETTDTVSTVASQQAYQIPATIRKLRDVYVNVGTTVYMPEVIYDHSHWKTVLASELGDSDTPLFAYVRGKTLLLEPTPASNGNTVTFVGETNAIDLSIADYTTGTITTATNASTAVVGSGTSWNASMAGRYIRIDDSNAVNVGDNRWYKIASVTDATNLVLEKPYEGTSITAGSASYTIGQMSPIPEEYDIAPVYRATALYWDSQGEHDRASTYWMLYDGGKEKGTTDIEGGIIGTMVSDNASVDGSYIRRSASRVVDINDYPKDLTGF